MFSEAKKGKNGVRLLAVVVVIVAVILAARHFGAFRYLTLENMAKLKDWIAGYGALGPVIYVLLWIAACLFFLPGLPVALLGGVAFGPIWGTVYSSVGSTAGAVLAFLVARYVARGMVEGWVAGNSQFKKIDDGVERQGWRILMVTRLVPAFPFNLQNFAYGLTRIPLPVYAAVSWICMLPGTIAFSFAGGSLTGGGDLKKTFTMLAVAAVFFVVISLIPGRIKKRRGGDLV